MSKESRKRAVERIRAAEARQKRRRQLLIGAGALVVAGGLAGGITAAVSGSGHPATGSGSGPANLASLSTLGTLKPSPAPGPNGPESVPIPSGAALASTATAASGKSVDGISCNTNEQLIFHIHAHLTIMVNGTPRQVPAGIGIPGAVTSSSASGPFVSTGTCFYWLHTHAADGIIHIESPVHRTFTLGNFFDEWGQQLGPNQAGPATGHVTVIYNGKVFRGNPRDVPLTAHAQIQLEVGSPLVAPETISWPSGI
ncbi:MAG: hypothetical protein J2P28_13020 [Actinobacteria bacterium]|nr:hypothetical protein [Actinomycetota bacterium]MBO0836410.1 hypothetical protein [Actinomycetota bacterium]